MQYALLSLAALAATATAQTMNLTAALTSNPQLSNLTTYVSLFPDLLTQLGSASNITILAPSNDAFAKFLNSSTGGGDIKSNDTSAIQAILTYHVLNGTYPASSIKSMPAFVPTMLTMPAYANVTGGQRVEALLDGMNVTFFSGLLQNSTVTTADLNFTGGVIHIIDNVLTIPENISTTAIAAGLSSAAGALTQTNLVSTLDSAKDLTVFVPNNAALEAIGSALPNLTTDQLAGILGYHVVNGTVGYSSTLTNGSMLTSMSGMNLTVTISNGSVFVNSAKVILPDVLVANGVVHVIDNVLNPNATSATPNPTASTQSVAFSGASSASSAPFTSGIPTPTSALGSGAAGAAASASSTSAAAGAMSSSSSKAAAAVGAMRTGEVALGALFAAGGAWMNL
ncbi:hypothetical protein MMC09_006938 [Bachmanniomyces sp. S44760]|nr:hypothetical protein [Bachmanniomyces sp. S44760]